MGAIFALICFASMLSPALANDNFPGTTITGNSGSLNASNTIATGQTGEPLTYNGGSLNTMWYSWTAPSNGTLTVQTCGGTTNFDTTLQTFTGATVGGLTQVATNDDSCGTQSLNTVTVTSGTIYRIQVDGYGSATGNFTLSWSFVAAANNADLSLSKSVSNASPVNGAGASYTLTLTNASGSPSSATGVTVQDTLPLGINFVSSSGDGSYNAGTGVWTVGTIAPGATRTLTINFTVAATAGATITNSAEVSASSILDPDSTPNNGSTTEDDDASVTFTVSGARTAGTPPALVCPAGTTVHDWDSVGWTAGSTNNNYAVTALGTVNFNITKTGGTWQTLAALGGANPALQNSGTGGLTPAQYSLSHYIDFASISQTATTTITLPTAVPGAQFRLFDVDWGSAQFADKITITGSYGGNAVTPILTNGVSNYVIGNSAYGDNTSDVTSANGNLVVTFSAPVDTISIIYGNHSIAPSDPGVQSYLLHDLTFCRPVATLNVTKISSVVSDTISGSNPKAIPGATVRYCITVTNAGSSSASNVIVSDNIPGAVTHVPGSMASGSSCGTAATPEDDDAAGADETDPFGMSITGSTITGTASTLGVGASYALVFNAIVD